MTTKTDFHSIMELKESFKPKERGWIDQKEAAQVKKVKSQVNFKNRTAETMMEGLFHVVFQDRF